MFFDGVSDLNELKKVYYKLVLKHHSDRGGDVRTMQQINAEHDKLFDELKAAQNKQAQSNSDVRKTTETPSEFREIISVLLNIENIEIELCGSWLWIGGNTKENKYALKAAGCRWSRSKTKWYWRHEEKGCYWSRGKASMSDIRNKYGSSFIVRQNEQLQLA